METLHQEGVTLIITVDNGIASVAEVDRARELGMDVVVTDHHRPQQRIPQACAVVDAYQQEDHGPYKDLSGAGVALKLVMALEGGDTAGVLEEYADLAALGTVADVVPVLGENRAIVKAGLRILAQGGRARGGRPHGGKRHGGQGGHCHQPGLYGDSPYQRHRPHGRPGAGGAVAHL